MEAFLPLAAKSVLVAGATLLLLKLARRRSAADRSLIAHLGMLALALLPVGYFLLPQLELQTGLMGSESAVVPAPYPSAPSETAGVASSAATFPGGEAPAVQPGFDWAGIDWAFWAYAVPAGLLILFTLIALSRLVLLKSKANVLVEPHWLSALAHAQRRMGFKHGTALLTSSELRSPISWGLMRPVILLNDEAAGAHGEAEAIIAHELAHVARLDWVKLLLSRVTVALFWFNPLVWLLAREAHQLREEAADDAVLATNIEDTDYARLLVGIARHECNGLLIGAHGVAPARNSLARRVQRVLDAASVRRPGGWKWASAAGFFAAGMAVPVAALQLVPTKPADALPGSMATQVASAVAGKAGLAPTGPMAGMTTSPDGQVIAMTKVDKIAKLKDVPVVDPDSYPDLDFDVNADDLTDAQEAIVEARAEARARMRDVRVEARAVSDDAISEAISAKANGVTAAYASGIRGAAPRVRTLNDIISLKVQGVTPDYVRQLSAAGYPNLSASQIISARVQGVTGEYARAMANAGAPRLAFEDVIELKVIGVSPEYVRKLRAAGYNKLKVKQIVEMNVHGVEPDDLKAADHDP